MSTAGADRHTLVTALAETVARLGDAPAYSDKVGITGAGWRTLSWNQLHAEVLAAVKQLGTKKRKLVTNDEFRALIAKGASDVASP